MTDAHPNSAESFIEATSFNRSLATTKVPLANAMESAVTTKARSEVNDARMSRNMFVESANKKARKLTPAPIGMSTKARVRLWRTTLK